MRIILASNGNVQYEGDRVLKSIPYIIGDKSIRDQGEEYTCCREAFQSIYGVSRNKVTNYTKEIKNEITDKSVNYGDRTVVDDAGVKSFIESEKRFGRAVPREELSNLTCADTPIQFLVTFQF